MDSRTRATMKYQKKNIKQMKLDLNRNTDSDIISFLETCENKQGYIKSLIRNDIKKSRAKQPSFFRVYIHLSPICLQRVIKNMKKY